MSEIENLHNTTIHNCSRDLPFTFLPNDILEDPRISWAAKGLLSYILGRPKDWIIHVWHLAKIYCGEKRGNGEDAIYSILKELRENGYVKYIKFKDEKGHWKHRYNVYSMPKDSEIKIKFPQPVEPDVGEPDLVKPDIKTSTELPNTELEKQVLCSSEPVGPKVGKIPIELKYKDYLGKEKIVRKDDLMFSATKCLKDWTILEIEKAWEIIIGYDKISDPFQLMNGIISNMRVKEYNLQQTKKMEKSCQKEQETPSSPYLKNFYDWSSKESLKKQSELANKHRLEKDMQMKEQASQKSKDLNQNSLKS